MLVEYHPESPSRRALIIGARAVFTMVWPDLRSWPAMATECSAAYRVSAGVSMDKFGEQLTKGIPRPSAA
jgi:hypothetical protein